MLQFSIVMHRKQPGYEVKAVVTFSKQGVISEEYQEKLKLMRNKLEQLVPGTYKVKYNLTHDELVITVKTDYASDAQRALYKFEEYIKSAATALQLS